MVEIVQISDIHIGNEFSKELMDNVILYLEKIVPDAIVCTGDITHKGRIDQYNTFLPYLERLKKIAPFLSVPGNHDLKNSGIVFYERLIGPRRSILELNNKETIIVAICSAKDDLSDGEIGDEQLEWMARHLDGSHQNQILMLHHHLIAPPYAGRKFSIVHDAGELIEFALHFNIQLVLMGHRHISHAYVMPPTTFLYCGTSASMKVRADDHPSFNKIYLDQDNLEIYAVNPLDLSEELVLKRKNNKTEFLRQRITRIEHIIQSDTYKDSYLRI